MPPGNQSPNSNLWEPVLHQPDQSTRSYDLSKLVYVAFFGGVIPLTVLGMRNARWLRVPPAQIWLLGALGVIGLLAKIAVAAGIIPIAADARTIRYISRGYSLLIYLGYYLAMRKPYQLHQVVGGETEPLLKDALIWIGVAMAAEFALISMALRWFHG